MKINYSTKTIEMTKAESKAAGKIGSDAFKELLNLMQQFPNYVIQITARNTAKKSSDFKGLTFSYMEKYIGDHEDADQIMSEYLDLRGMSDSAKAACAGSRSYQEIKVWFLAKFPEIKEFHNKRNSLLCGVAN